MQGWQQEIPKQFKASQNQGQGQKDTNTNNNVEVDKQNEEQKYLEDIKKRDKGSKEIILREKQGIFQYQCYDQQHKDLKLMENTRDFTQSQDGQYQICVSDSQITVIDTKLKKVLNSIKNFTQIKHVTLTENNQYIQIMDCKGVEEYVTQLYTFPDFQIKSQFTDKVYVQDNWPVVKMTSDYKFALKYNFQTFKIDCFDLGTFLKVRDFDVGIIDIFYLSPDSDWEDFSLICFQLEKMNGFNKINGKLQIFNFGLEKPFFTTELLDTNFIKLVWGAKKRRALVKQESYSDSSNQSYYGKTKLNLLDLDQKNPKKIFREIPTSEGPLHDFCWSPVGDRFLVLSGFMPASIILYNKECKPEFDLGSAYRNTLRWSSVGRFCIVAGFGNLKGEIDIWDMEELKKIGNCVSSASGCCFWSPDGRKFLTATTTPQLRVDNMFRIYYYDGTLLQKLDYSKSELYQVNWVNSKEKYSARGASPEVLKRREQIQSEKKPETRQFFRPPGFSEFAISSNFKQNTQSLSQALQIPSQKQADNKPQQVLKPGQVPIEQKPKKKRVRKRDFDKQNQKQDDDEEEDEEK